MCARLPLDRLPPGQRLVADFPVLHAGSVPHINPQEWRLEITGLVQKPLTLTWEDLLALPTREQVCDIHCVTGWSKFDTRWKGVPVSLLGAQVEPRAEARHVVAYAVGGWTTNLPLEELMSEDVLLAYEYEGRPLAAEHGGPVRLLVPRLYFWKSAKWLTGLEFTREQRLGYWEQRGYHPLGDPWLEQRYA